MEGNSIGESGSSIRNKYLSIRLRNGRARIVHPIAGREEEICGHIAARINPSHFIYRNSMKNNYLKLTAAWVAGAVIFLSACKSDKTAEKAPADAPAAEVSAPRFDRHSAYAFVEKQVAFGPRVPNTAAHTACKNWYVERLRAYGAEVIEQSFQPTAYTGTVMQATNILKPIRIV